MNPTQKLVSLLTISLLVFVCTDSQAAYPGTYNHKAQIAYIEVYDNLELDIDSYNKIVTIIAVDFRNRKLTKLASGKNFGWMAINHDNTILSYSDGKGTHFIDAKDGHLLFDIKTSSVRQHWADNRNVVAVVDTGSNKRIFEIDVDQRRVKSAKLNDMVWYVKWSKDCECFLYEVSDNINDTRRTVRLQNHKLRGLKTRKNLTLSDDGKYYYSVLNENDDDAGTFEVFRTSDNKSVAGPFDAISTPLEVEILWGKNTIRLLEYQSLFDLKTGSLLSPPIWFSNEDTPPLNIPSPYFDKAADRSRHVLRWHDNKKYFEVEDSYTGKIVRTYKKFW